MAQTETTQPNPEPAGSAGLKSFFKALYKAVRTGKKSLSGTEHPEVQRILGENVSGAEKACALLRKSHAKLYKDYPLDDDDALGKAIDEEEMSYGEWKKSLATKSAAPEMKDGAKPETNPDAKPESKPATPPGTPAPETGGVTPESESEESEEETLAIEKSMAALNETLEAICKAI